MVEDSSYMSELSDNDRQVLQVWVADFDQSWSPERLTQRVRELRALRTPFCVPVVKEMVKIDLQRHWQQGHEI